MGSRSDFSNVSSRTYVSTLERGLKNPTLDKIEDLASVMRLHPLTLITLAYMIERNDIDLEFKDPKELFRVVTKELSQLTLV